MRYVIGRFSVRPGKRAELLEKAHNYVAASRADAGCVYFDMAPMPDNPDGVVMVECWETQDAHKAHLATAYATAFNPTAGALILKGEFQEMNVDKPDNVVLDFTRT
jgi:quinol monooxygenase YgiN